jgi:hypothetical protein
MDALKIYDSIVLFAFFVFGFCIGVMIASLLNVFNVGGWLVGSLAIFVTLIFFLVNAWLIRRNNRLAGLLVTKTLDGTVDLDDPDTHPKLPALPTRRAALLGVPVGLTAALTWSPATISALIPF